MSSSMKPKNEEERIKELRSYQILDTLPEADFDDIVSLASNICETPIAIVSFVDSDRQWFKAKVGLNAKETPRNVAFCAHAILDNKIFCVENALEDERFKNNPLVKGELGIRFYAGSPLKTSNGSNLGTLCVIDSKPRELSKNQQQSLDALSRMIVNLLELRKKRHQAEESEKRKSAFIANISHELRTPMNGILGMLDLLKDTSLNEDQKDYVETMAVSGESLLFILNDILDLSKLEANQTVFESLEFVPQKSIQAIVDLHRPCFLKKGLKLNFSCNQKEEVCLRGDKQKIGQIITNFVSNAAKFTESGAVDIELNLTEQNNRCQFVCHVKDTGIGMSPLVLQSIFKPFAQADGSTTRRFGGTGLGLTICQKMAELMGGSVSVRSEVGVGSCFTLELNLPIAHFKDLPNESKTTPSSEEVYPLKILVAEDNLVNQKVIMAHLKALGQEPVLAANGKECEELFAKEHFDLIFMDGFMPEQDGFETTRRIRAMSKNQPFIVAVTASVSKAQKAECDAAGMDSFVSKPIKKNDLARLIRIVFKAIHKKAS